VYKLFLADDELIIIKGLKKLLDWPSLMVEIIGEATNGRDAEEGILRSRPDLAILDIRMPLCSGLDILHTIKEQALDTRVIFLSAYEKFAYAQDALDSGAQNYLTKPVNREKLKETVEEAIRQIEAAHIAKDALEKVFRIEKTPLLKERQNNTTIRDMIKLQKNEQVRQLIVYMDEHHREDIPLKRIAKRAFMNPSYFSVYFKKNVGINFKECLTRIRLEHALVLLEKEDIKTYELAEKVGFENAAYFSELFKRAYGKSPLEYKQGIKTK
jgi:YesN/AraC family two-component response regulator